MDEGFIATAYPKVQENLKLTVEEQRIDELGQHMADLVSKEVDEIVMDAVDWAIQALLRDCFSDLPKADMKEILHHRMWETNSYKAHEDHKKLYEALEKSMDRDHSDQLLTDLVHLELQEPLKLLDHLNCFLLIHLHPQTIVISQKAHWLQALQRQVLQLNIRLGTTTETRLMPSVSRFFSLRLHMDDDSAPDEQVHSSDDEDIGNDHIPKVNLKQDWWKPLPEEDRPATPEPAWVAGPALLSREDESGVVIIAVGLDANDNMANEQVPSPATIRSDGQILLFNAWVPIGKALTASADVPSSFTATTETTSTLPPSPPPLQQSTVHRDIWWKVKDLKNLQES
ncbi:hypothetical protein Tco_1008896 [Tanacetum coccineum]